MKFDKLLRFAEEKGLEYVATGHYALIEYDRSVRQVSFEKSAG